MCDDVTTTKKLQKIYMQESAVKFMKNEVEGCIICIGREREIDSEIEN